MKIFIESLKGPKGDRGAPGPTADVEGVKADLQKESTERLANVAALNDAISLVEAKSYGDFSLKTDLQKEVSDRISDVSALNSRIDDESLKAKTASDSLSSRIETVASQTYDDSQIRADIQAVDDAFKNLMDLASSDLDTLKEVADKLASSDSTDSALLSAINDEKQVRTTQVSDLTSLINSGLQSEEAARKSDVSAVNTRVDGVIANAYDDTELQAKVVAEVAARIQAEADLSARIDAVVEQSSSVDAGVDARQKALGWYNVKTFGPTGTIDDLPTINKALEASRASGGGYVVFPAGTYIVSDSVVVPTGTTIIGASRLKTKIQTNNDNAPVITSDSWKYNVGSSYGIRIHGIMTEGTGQSTVAITNQHGILLHGYFHVIYDCEARNTKGHGLGFTSVSGNGTASLTNMVENVIYNCRAQVITGNCFHYGETTNKITDGYAASNWSSNTSLGVHVYMGSSAGWRVRDQHTYGFTPGDAFVVSNAFNTSISGTYIETFANATDGTAIRANSIQFNLSLKDTQIIRPKSSIKDKVIGGLSSYVIDLDKSSAYDGSPVTIDGLQIRNSHDSSAEAIHIRSSGLRVSARDVTRSGKYGSKIRPIGGVLNGLMTAIQNTSAPSNSASYGRRFKYEGGTPKTLVFPVATPSLYTAYSLGLSISGFLNWNTGGISTSYKADLMISCKAVTDAISYGLLQVSAPVGFQSNPTVTVTRFAPAGNHGVWGWQEDPTEPPADPPPTPLVEPAYVVGNTIGYAGDQYVCVSPQAEGSALNPGAPGSGWERLPAGCMGTAGDGFVVSLTFTPNTSTYGQASLSGPLAGIDG